MNDSTRALKVLKAQPNDLVRAVDQAVGRGFWVAPTERLLRTVAESVELAAGSGRRTVDSVHKSGTRSIPEAA
ncbi:MAG: hypothetical protein HN979_02850 [Actinobacteria bacterium]|jgi:hypothetical protein|nr:hypothetical protein [Actinomycetota bacterium]MBT3687518.1 hypothetical protein [Actinomycetota bacterium]MBT4037667.1 hypothetical protein [Actinomycetota bacterium]MBT4278274.1 hypothetical protein [Actinomycetota bacterium]MBT4343637.1 hypothetical protein [Actinomycetota bacterium]